ncbi:hypothetical protein [Singulisphaera acidiphila]|uniref:Secreted protein n=1 Tax=Singulisphaera acidiphila (strain ATCC BAA-1392 / DSM 18658 / VKM B-2454 / MOB10) TaxID=886293 RepID=L0DKM0_SINAD|nr:hypothetical protein [Singulisphaera acidiphila]AGA29365.1 hypothetical protein Sinac_5213 [Singulisphaera acidiphila DSM 18658]
MTKQHSKLARWSGLSLVIMLVAMGSVCLPGCGGGETKEAASQAEYPAVNKAADDAQLEFMKNQGKKTKK